MITQGAPKDGNHYVRMTPRGEVQAPVAFRDALEKWARGHGRHADLVYVPAICTWQVRLSPMPNDPQLELHKQGKVKYEELWETIELVEAKKPKEITAKSPSPYKPIPLGEIGIDGLLALLDKGNMWSRRGDFNSLQEALVAARERQKMTTEKLRRDERDNAGYMAQWFRRQIFKVPFLRVGIDLKSLSETPAPQGDVR